MKNKSILKTIICILISIIQYFIYLPPINFSSPKFYSYLFVILFVYAFLSVLFNSTNIKLGQPLTIDKSIFKSRIFIIIITIILIQSAAKIIYSPILVSKLYAERITIDQGDFQQDIPEVDPNSLPLLDRLSTERIGDRVMGEIPELISQFIVSDEYTQINYKSNLIRVTPLEYADFFRWLFNKENGIPGYIKVTSTTGESDFVNVKGGINYSPSAIFFKNINLHLRLSFPTLELSTPRFEIDEDGNPYWITSVISYKGIGMLQDVSHVIETNAITGENVLYKVGEVDKWIDNVYPSNLVIQQIDDWGTYQGGFINSIIGKRDVKVSTTGYTYLTTGDDVSLYTGITSVTKDESNIGFVLVNLRNKNATYYPAPGAQEYSAMHSAKGAIQEKQYIPTFPLLTNVDGLPTYLLSLKDNAGLVKAYALVDVADYQKVVVTDSMYGIQQAIDDYRHYMGKDIIVEGNNITIGTIVEIYDAVVDGNTYYYMTIIDDDNIYKADISINDILPFIKVNDQIEIKYDDNLYISNINRLSK